MEEFSRGSGVGGDSRSVMNSKVGFLRGDSRTSYGNQSPGITITSDTVQVEIKFRNRIDENRDRGKYFSSGNVGGMEEAIVPEMKNSNCEGGDDEDLNGEFEFCRVDVGSIDCSSEERQNDENNQITYEEYNIDETYESRDELMLEDSQKNYEKGAGSFAFCKPQDMDSPANDNTNTFVNRKFDSSNVNSSAISPTPLQMNEADPKLDDLVKKILKCDLCPPQVKLTNFNESFAHHQHHHGLKFCPVCFQLVNCHDEFVQEHLKSSHLINDDGDVYCPICSIPIHHILCFDHIKKDHLRGYYERYEIKPEVHRMKLPIINPPETKIPHSLLVKKPVVDHEEHGTPFLPKLGSSNIEHREPIKCTVNITNPVDEVNTHQGTSKYPDGFNKKITRNKLTDQQTQLLDSYFERKKHPSLVDRMDLARACNLPVQTITAWFGNRRRLRINWDKISEHKRSRLLSAFENNCRPTHAEIDRLCSELGFNYTQVSTWFKTRLLTKNKLLKRRKLNSHLSAKRRVTEMLKAKLESSDSDSTISNVAASMSKPTLACLDGQKEKPVHTFTAHQVYNSQPLGVNEKFTKVQDWINHIVEKNIPDSPDELLEPTNEEQKQTAFETQSKRLEENPVRERTITRSPSPPVLTRPCTPPFQQKNLPCAESARIARCSSPVAPVLTVQTSAEYQPLKKIQRGQQFSFETKQILREHFRTEQYLTDKQKKFLAETIGTTRERIANWFQLERSRLKSFLNGSKDLNSKARAQLLGRHRRMENIDLQDIYEKFVNFFTRGNCFTNSQETKLIKKFAENIHPDPNQISLIAKDIGASREKVSQWFTNRFQRLRRGKLPGYDLKGGVLIRLGTDTTYSEIKSEPADVSSCNQSNIPFRIAKKEARPAVPTLQWTRSKESPLLTVIKQEFPTEFRNVPPKQSMLCLNSIIDNEKRLVVKVRKLPISPGTVIKVKDSELDMFDSKFRSPTMTDTNTQQSPSISKSLNKSESFGNRRVLPGKERSHNTPGTSSSSNSTHSSKARHFSAYQKQLLEEHYSRNEFPTNGEIKVIAGNLELNELQVSRWFAYKRHLVKKEERQKKRKQLVMSAKLRKSTRKCGVETVALSLGPRFKKKITNRCTGFLESQRDILWKSFGKCDSPNQDNIRQLAEETGLTAIQIDQWFRQQRYKKRHKKGIFALQSPNKAYQENKSTSVPECSPVDIKPTIDGIKKVDSALHSGAEGNREAVKSYTGMRTRRRTSIYQANCTNMNPASLVKIEMNAETDSESKPSSSRANVLHEPEAVTKLPPPVRRSREHSEYRRTYSRGKVQGNTNQPKSLSSETPSPNLEKRITGKISTYLDTTVPLPLNLLNRFNTIRAMNISIFQKKISKLALKFEDLVEIYVLCDDESKNWIQEETQTLKNIIELHEKSSIVFTCEQEDILIERRLKILNELLKKRPTDVMWCSTVNSFHLENVFRSWYFLGVYCILSSLSLGDGIADLSSKLNVLPNGPTPPATWLIPPVLEP